MPIGVGAKPAITIGGTTDVKIVNWDTTGAGSIPAGTAGIGKVIVTAITGTSNVAITSQPIGVSGTVTGIVAASGTQDVSIVNIPTITGSVSISGTANALIVAQPIGISGSVTPLGTVAISGSASVINTVAISGSVTAIGIATTADMFAIEHGSSLRYAAVTTSVNFARINLVTSGDGIIVTSAAGKSVIVLSFVLNGNGANAAVIASSVSAVPIGPTIFIATSGVGMVLNHNPHGWFRTTTGHSLVLNVASSGSVAGCLTYILSTTG